MKHRELQVFLLKDIFYVSPLKKVARIWHLISNLSKPLGPQFFQLPGFDDCCGDGDHDGDDGGDRDHDGDDGADGDDGGCGDGDSDDHDGGDGEDNDDHDSGWW